MVIWSEFRMWKYRDNNYREGAPHFDKYSQYSEIFI